MKSKQIQFTIKRQKRRTFTNDTLDRHNEENYPIEAHHDPALRTKTMLKYRATGIAAAKREDWAAARMNLLTAVSIVPEDAQLLEMLAQVELEDAKTFEAIKHLTHALRIRPTWSTAWHTKARALLNYGEIPLAIQAFQTALEQFHTTDDASTLNGIQDELRSAESLLASWRTDKRQELRSLLKDGYSLSQPSDEDDRVVLNQLRSASPDSMVCTESNEINRIRRLVHPADIDRLDDREFDYLFFDRASVVERSQAK